MTEGKLGSRNIILIAAGAAGLVDHHRRLSARRRAQKGRGWPTAAVTVRGLAERDVTANLAT
jgi:hypothetical protein